MDKKHLIELTNNLYRLTLLFPQKEPLRNRMRLLADDILANLIFLSDHSENSYFSEKEKVMEISSKTLKNFEIIDGFFNVAMSQNWISPRELSEIKEEYIKTKEEYRFPLVLGPQIPVSNASIAKVKSEKKIKHVDLIEKNPRRMEILKILKEKRNRQVGDFTQIFPKISKRTIRRDFENLLKNGLIKRKGQRSDTFYELA